MPIKVSVIPPSPKALNNQLFDTNSRVQNIWQGNSHWKDKEVEWYNQAKINGIELNTFDLLPPEEADIIIYYDLPTEKATIEETKKKSPSAKHLLILIESPFRPYWFDKRNYVLFDAVLTYNPHLVDDKKFIQYYLPNSHPPTEINIQNFYGRKMCLLLNSHYYIGIKSHKTPIHFFIDLISSYKKGWKYSPTTLFTHYNNFLYSERKKFAETAQEFTNFLDVYGKGWHGNKYSWYYRFFPDKPLNPVPKPFVGEKLELINGYKFVLAFENYRGNVGYISEKIFDVMYGGAVPIYLGDENITDYVDSDCFIDARDFKTYYELCTYITNYTPEQWLATMQRISSFLKSEKIKKFLPEYYAETINKLIIKLHNNE